MQSVVILLNELRLQPHHRCSTSSSCSSSRSSSSMKGIYKVLQLDILDKNLFKKICTPAKRIFSVKRHLVAF